MTAYALLFTLAAVGLSETVYLIRKRMAAEKPKARQWAWKELPRRQIAEKLSDDYPWRKLERVLMGERARRVVNKKAGAVRKSAGLFLNIIQPII